MAGLSLNGVPVSGTARKRIARALINGYLQLDRLATRAQLKRETLVAHLRVMGASGMGIIIEDDTVVLRRVKQDWNKFIRVCEERLKEYPAKCPERVKVEGQITRLRKEALCQTE